MVSDIEFDRPTASLPARAAVFTTTFEELAEEFKAMQTRADVVDKLDMLDAYKGHVADWRQFQEDCTTEHLSALSWDEMKEMTEQNRRITKALTVMGDEIGRIMRLIGAL